jgi:segregation and condensation protein A
MQDKILQMLMNKDEITWQTILLDLVKTGELNPWDVDISTLSKKYVEIVRKMQEANLFVSAKVLLASAILLKIKAERLLSEGIAAIDYYLYPQEDVEELEEYAGRKRIVLDVSPVLTIKTPMPRKRRVTVSDLLGALDKALEVNERRVLRRAREAHVPEKMMVPDKSKDITVLIKELHSKMKDFFKFKPEITFSELVGSNIREDKLLTFAPLLHLANQSTVNLNQFEHFGEIYIKLFEV